MWETKDREVCVTTPAEISSQGAGTPQRRGNATGLNIDSAGLQLLD